MVDLTFAVTNRCNSRCRMCEIWKSNKPDVLEIEDFERLPNNLGLVNVTGGEPTLREDLSEIIEILKGKSKRIYLSTNGMIFNEKIRDIEVRVSIDGLETKHDYMRGIEGAFECAIENAKRYKKNGNSVGLAFTITKENYEDFFYVYSLSKNLGMQFTATIAHNSFYFNKFNNKIKKNLSLYSEIDLVVDEMVKGWNPVDLFRAYFIDHMKGWIEGQKRPVSCGAGKKTFFINYDGKVYPCNMIMTEIGNIREESLSDIIKRSKEIKNCKKECWQVCTVHTMVRRNPIKFLSWVLYKKLRVII